MLFNISNNYGHAYEDLKEKLVDFNFNWIDDENATIELNTMEELVKLIKILGEDEFDQKVLVREDHITYFVD